MSTHQMGYGQGTIRLTAATMPTDMVRVRTDASIERLVFGASTRDDALPSRVARA